MYAGCRWVVEEGKSLHLWGVATDQEASENIERGSVRSDTEFEEKSLSLAAHGALGGGKCESFAVEVSERTDL